LAADVGLWERAESSARVPHAWRAKVSVTAVPSAGVFHLTGASAGVSNKGNLRGRFVIHTTGALHSPNIKLR